MFLDEAHFDLGGYVNKQNCRTDTEKPHAYFEKPTHPKWITVWCGFWHNWVVFLRNKQEAVTVNGDRYRAMFAISLMSFSHLGKFFGGPYISICK